MASLVCFRFLLYLPLAWKVFPKDSKVFQNIFFRWWSCTFFLPCLYRTPKKGGPPERGYFGFSPTTPTFKKITCTTKNSGGIRDGETTIKIKFALLRGVGLGGREQNRPKTLFFFFFVGNATTIKFWKCKFYCREVLLSLRRLLRKYFRGHCDNSA